MSDDKNKPALSGAALENQESFGHMAIGREGSVAEVNARAVAIIHAGFRRSPEHHWPHSYYGPGTHRWWT